MGKKNHTKKEIRNYNKEKLLAYLRPLSLSQTQYEMREEWALEYVYDAHMSLFGDVTKQIVDWIPDIHFTRSKKKHKGFNSGIDCPCSHPNIRYLCYIRNKVTQHSAIIGSTCLKWFLDIYLPTTVWRTLEKMSLREPIIPTVDILNILPPFKLDNYEQKFMASMRALGERGKKLTPRQSKFLVKVNNNILYQIHYWHLSQTDAVFNASTYFERKNKTLSMMNEIFEKLTREKEYATKKKEERKRKRRLAKQT